jgi:hypothetical protein
MSWTEIIAQIEAEIALLQSARDILAGTPAHPKTAPGKKLEKRAPQKRKQPARAVLPVAVSVETQELLFAPPAPQPEPPQVQRVPPRRRIERRPLQRVAAAESVSTLPAALTGAVPAGPVAVSANEARKAQERSTPAPPAQVPAEIPTQIGGERSLGSLVRAFERSVRLSGMGTP